MANKGLTLLELVVVIAVIAILATVAITSYNRHQLATKDKEAISILRGLVQAQKRFYSENGCYAWVFPPSGRIPPTNHKQPWLGGSRAGWWSGWGRTCIQPWGAYITFNQLDFRPTSSLVYFTYYCGSILMDSGPAFACAAWGDLDGDGRINRWDYCSEKRVFGMQCERGEYKKWNTTRF
jgi:prepilin-type N-terminal cleavage/methylation domain-containing protein